MYQKPIFFSTQLVLSSLLIILRRIKLNLVSIFHNNIRSLNRNLENLVTHYLQEIGIHFNIIGVTETKITNSNENTGPSNIPGYVFEHVPTPLACGGVRLFVDETLSHSVLEKAST